jgi:predicted trehalose synthase
MDPTTMIYLLVVLMTVSGGIMGAFWLRALTLMRRRVIDSAEALEQLAETVAELRNEMNVLGERVDLAERLPQGRDGSDSPEDGAP